MRWEAEDVGRAIRAEVPPVERAHAPVAHQRDVNGPARPRGRHPREPARQGGRPDRPAALVGDQHTNPRMRLTVSHVYQDCRASSPRPETVVAGRAAVPLPLENASYALTIC